VFKFVEAGICSGALFIFARFITFRCPAKEFSGIRQGA
jgi:hypothetical protein